MLGLRASRHFGLAGPFGTEGSIVLLRGCSTGPSSPGDLCDRGLVSLALGEAGAPRRGPAAAYRGPWPRHGPRHLRGSHAINAVALEPCRPSLPEFAEFVLNLIVIAIVSRRSAHPDQSSPTAAGRVREGPAAVLGAARREARTPPRPFPPRTTMSGPDRPAEHLILMRLADAIARPRPSPGCRSPVALGSSVRAVAPARRPRRPRS